MQKIHHADDADARHRRISIIIARDRAARRDHRAATAFGMLRPHGELSKCRDDDSICPAASTAVFFGCRRYRDNASVDTEFFAR